MRIDLQQFRGATASFNTPVGSIQGGEDVGSAAFPHPYYGSEGTGEAYAFHPGGAQFAMGDGSVRFISETINIRDFARLVTRDKGEVLAQ